MNESDFRVEEIRRNCTEIIYDALEIKYLNINESDLVSYANSSAVSIRLQPPYDHLYGLLGKHHEQSSYFYQVGGRETDTEGRTIGFTEFHIETDGEAIKCEARDETGELIPLVIDQIELAQTLSREIRRSEVVAARVS